MVSSKTSIDALCVDDFLNFNKLCISTFVEFGHFKGINQDVHGTPVNACTCLLLLLRI